MEKVKLQNPLRDTKNSLGAYRFKKRCMSVAVSIFRYVFLVSFSYVLLYPMIYMISHAIQNPSEYRDPTVQWVPKGWTLINFKHAFEAFDYLNGFMITVFTMIISALVEVVTCGIAAYGMARFDFKGKKILNVLLILSILVPTTMIIIPSYLNFRNMDFLGVLGLIGRITGKELTINLLDTPLVFYLPSVFAVGLQSGLFIFIYIQFFKSFPKELEEAAWIDGCGPWKTFFNIVVPSSTVSIMTVTIFSVIWHWNEYYLPSMYYSKGYPLAVKVYDAFQVLSSAGYSSYSGEGVNAAMAGCLLFILPVLIMYLILQRKFIESIVKTGIVG